ncbi:MAG TPA: Fe-S-binding domain-containing protein, partial [Bryobacterales bacterium]|nr:Fe-S-binding domain-containing protein [Bryobacterales bacterium]
GRELAAIVPLIVMMAWMGIYSQTFLPRITASTARLIEPIELRVKNRAAPAPAMHAPPRAVEVSLAR